MGRLLFWCNVGSAAVVVVGACVLYPTARALCDPEVQAFAAAPGGRGGVQALVSCGQRLAQHGAAWGEEHAADIAAEAWLQAQDAAAWAAQTALVLAVHLWHALCAAWRVVAAFLGHALPLVCSAGQSAGRALADARPLDTALGLARKATILGRATGGPRVLVSVPVRTSRSSSRSGQCGGRVPDERARHDVHADRPGRVRRRTAFLHGNAVGARSRPATRQDVSQDAGARQRALASPVLG